jgi:hypothetical protein
LLLAVGFVVVAGIGCSKSVSSVAARCKQPPEVKKAGIQRMAAMNTNGYAVAIMELQEEQPTARVSAATGQGD